ncbi:arginyltransferase [Magnetofaba australis]|uniref:Aspartate/glutamate leucyltransferase n=1 Tax=Magnetofaba australis IT-1 TaxID=1434232 RepID=A0A1Y2K9N7_9PROT|nr:arginyltransferase [Magnetofaba australis]OSM06170.1 putative arginyl-tRNA-protein transferase [Magnetofaba australis IT-1]
MSDISRIDSSAQRLDLLLTPPHACNYLTDRQSAILFVEPSLPMESPLYEHLLERGFRRSSEHVYRPYCPQCDACVSVRIPVDRFRMTRSFKRVIKRNADLKAIHVQPGFRDEWFALYQRYIHVRHTDGPMDNPEPEQFLDFLDSPWSDTLFIEFRLGAHLAMVAVVDYQPKGLSAVYTFFDPDLTSRSLGAYAILWQIEEAKRLNKSHVYLGYWIHESPKMRYKARFQPLEAYRDRQWRDLTPEEIEMGVKGASA